MVNNANTIDSDKKVKKRLATKKWREKIKKQEEMDPYLETLNRKKRNEQHKKWLNSVRRLNSVRDEHNKKIREARIKLKEDNPELLKLRNKKQVDYNNNYKKRIKNLQMFLSILLVSINKD